MQDSRRRFADKYLEMSFHMLKTEVKSSIPAIVWVTAVGFASIVIKEIWEIGHVKRTSREQKVLQTTQKPKSSAQQSKLSHVTS